MEILMWLIMILYGVIGGVSTIAMVVGIPAIIVWKFYRKAKYGIALMK